MTSSNFRTIPTASVVVQREIRQRRELEPKALEELANSIQQLGLINPITVDANNVLVAGERRLTACRDILGWTHIPVQYIEDCTEEELKLIELEENVRRKDLDWKDECHAIKDYHEHCTSIDSNWTMARTAERLNTSQSLVSQKIDVAKALLEEIPLVIQADKFSVARGVVQRRTERQQADASNQIADMLGGNSKKELDPSGPVREETSGRAAGRTDLPGDDSDTTADAPFIHADFIQWLRTYSGPKFNFIHCDFPYGVSADKHAQGAADKFGGYDDSADVYWDLMAAFSTFIRTGVAESAHCMFWFSMSYYTETKKALEDMGWVVNDFPLVWTKGNVGILPDPKRGGRRTYETAFHCTRGDRPVVRAKAMSIETSAPKEIHMSEKSPEMLRHFFEMYVDDSTVMLDPTMGSGNAVKVAEAMGAKTILGLEKEKEFYDRAVSAYLADKSL